MPVDSPTHDSRWRRVLRPAGRWLVLFAAVALAWPLRQESSTSVFLPVLSPFIAVASVISVRTVSVLASRNAPTRPSQWNVPTAAFPISPVWSWTVATGAVLVKPFAPRNPCEP